MARRRPKDMKQISKYRSFAEKFGSHLRKIRKSKNMSQEDLAKKAGCNISFIGSIERGQKSPTLYTLSKIADGLDIHMAKLFDLSEERKDVKELKSLLEDRFFTIIQLSSEDSLKLLAELLQGFINFEEGRKESLN